MDYEVLGNQYLFEAITIEERAVLLRKTRTAPGDANARLNMLTAMYLELRVTGNALLERGRKQ